MSLTPRHLGADILTTMLRAPPAAFAGMELYKLQPSSSDSQLSQMTQASFNSDADTILDMSTLPTATNAAASRETTS